MRKSLEDRLSQVAQHKMHIMAIIVQVQRNLQTNQLCINLMEVVLGM